MKKTIIYVVRHAQSEHNLSGSLSNESLEIYGMLGSPLTEEGKQQASTLTKELEHLHVDYLIASHLNRARQTAEILGEVFGLPVITTETIQERLDSESELEAGTRLLTLLQKIADEWREKTVVVVSHGAIFRGLLTLLGFAPLRELPPGSVANMGYAVLETTDGKTWIVTHTQGITRTL
jgi:broad specificity phosphatase PhoE